MRRHLLLLIVAAAAPGLFAPALAEESPALKVQRLKIVLKSAKKDGSPRDRIRITANFPTLTLSPDYDARIDGFSLSVGGETVLAFPPVDDRARLDRESGRRWRYRERKSKDRSGVRRLYLNASSGLFELKAKKLDLGALHSAGPEGVRVVVTLGESVFTADLDLRVKEKAWTFKAAKPGLPPWSPPSGTWPPPAGFSFRILEVGGASAISAPETAVARNMTEYVALWARHHPPIPCLDPRMCPGVPEFGPPAVDFTKEIVVAVFLGQAMNGETADILSAVRDGTGASVTWAEVRLGLTCPVPMYVTIPTPYVLAAITRVEGTVSFEKRVTVKQCF